MSLFNLEVGQLWIERQIDRQIDRQIEREREREKEREKERNREREMKGGSCDASLIIVDESL